MKKPYTRNTRIVPRTDTGTLAEKANACRVNVPQGIRQNRPVPSVEGLAADYHPSGLADLRLAVTRGPRLFTKNVADC